MSSLKTIKTEITATELSSGINLGTTNLIAVSKTKPMDQIKSVIDEGQVHFGENKVQEAVEKWEDVKKSRTDLKLHLLGALQTNKVKNIFGVFDYIHSLDRLSLAQKLSKEVEKRGYCPKLFIQVNTGKEEQKSGIYPEKLKEFADICRETYKLEVVGLMCIPPVNSNSRDHFELLRELAHDNGLKELSMGMSADFKIAINCGATFIRVGTSIFGKREK
jgi:hypothetical protein